MRIVRINKGKAVSLPVRLVLVAMTVFSIVKVIDILSEPWSMLIVVVLCSFLPAVWFATRIIFINEENKTIFDGVWTMGSKLGKPLKYDTIEEIIIERVQTKETTYTLADKKTIVSDNEYRAYLKISNGVKYFLLSHPLKERIEEKVTKIKQKLEIN